MRTYLRACSIAFSQQLVYRTNFIFGRLRNIIVLLLQYYLWLTVSSTTGAFASYTKLELMTYVFGTHLLVAFVFGWQSREIAREIDSGELSRDLVRPLHHGLYFYFRELAERMLFLVFACAEVALVAQILDVDLMVQTQAFYLGMFLLSVFFAHILYYLLSYLFSLLAFWTREAMGPRFLFEWVLEFAAGRYFPLSIVSAGWLVALHSLPFLYLLYMPMEIYLGRMAPAQVLGALGIQLLWIGAIGLLATVAWRTGLRRYSGEGM